MSAGPQERSFTNVADGEARVGFQAQEVHIEGGYHGPGSAAVPVLRVKNTTALGQVAGSHIGVDLEVDGSESVDIENTDRIDVVTGSARGVVIRRVRSS
jgi:hypothetical protein